MKDKAPEGAAHSSDTAGQGGSGALWRKQFEGLVRDDARHRRRGGSRLAHPEGKSNRGVRERDQRDRKEAEAARERADSALERKAQLYDRLAGGEVQDDAGVYGVDFLRKSSGEAAGGCSAAAPPGTTRATMASGGGEARASLLRARRAKLKEQRRARLKAKHFEKLADRVQ